MEPITTSLLNVGPVGILCAVLLYLMSKDRSDRAAERREVKAERTRDRNEMRDELRSISADFRESVEKLVSDSREDHAAVRRENTESLLRVDALRQTGYDMLARQINDLSKQISENRHGLLDFVNEVRLGRKAADLPERQNRGGMVDLSKLSPPNPVVNDPDH